MMQLSIGIPAIMIKYRQPENVFPIFFSGMRRGVLWKLCGDSVWANRSFLIPLAGVILILQYVRLLRGRLIAAIYAITNLPRFAVPILHVPVPHTHFNFHIRPRPSQRDLSLLLFWDFLLFRLSVLFKNTLFVIDESASRMRFEPALFQSTYTHT